MCSLHDAPSEVLEDIAVFAVFKQDAPLGPPNEWRALMLSCRAVHRSLNDRSSKAHTLSRIFGVKFDLSAPRRRFPSEKFLSTSLELELRRRFRVLGWARTSSLSEAELLEIFTTAYLMLLEDCGLNFQQLLWAKVPDLVERYLRDSSHFLGSRQPLDTPLDSFALVLLWRFMSEQSLRARWSSLLEQMENSLIACALNSTKYSFSSFPEHIHRPVSQDADANESAVSLEYFGTSIRVPVPPIGQGATLLTFARKETFPLYVPPQLPVDRAEALALGRRGATQSAIHHINDVCRTRFVAVDEHAGAHHDTDWSRLVRSPGGMIDVPQSNSTPHKLGSLNGRWAGFKMCLQLQDYEILQNDDQLPSNGWSASRSPFFIDLQEFYGYKRDGPYIADDDQSGFINAFFPIGSIQTVEDGRLKVQNQDVPTAYFDPMPRWRSDGEAMPPSDVIVYGETDEENGESWYRWKATGRVRLSDGLIVLVITPLLPFWDMLGEWVFRGYLLSSQNFIGRGRLRDAGVGPAVQEHVFSLRKERLDTSADH